MTTASPTLGNTVVVATHLFIPWTGVWVADLDLDLTSDQPVPTGKQTLNVGGASLQGTIDDERTGRFGEKVHARLVGGGGAWPKPATAEHFHNDATNGVRSDTVTAPTGNAIGETVNDAAPVSLGIDFVRSSGAARRVLDGRDWYVDADGITQLGKWPTVAMAADVEFSSYDPLTRVAIITADSIVWPGSTFTDDRFGTIIARDVEQTFIGNKGRAFAWHSPVAETQQQAAFRSMVEEYGGLPFMRCYRYRITDQNSVDGRVTLESVNLDNGMPKKIGPLSVFGNAGITAEYLAGTVALVEFVEGASGPIVRGFDTTQPSKLHLDAATLIELGKNAPTFAARGDTFDQTMTALKLFGATTPLGTIPQIAAAIAALKTALDAILTPTQTELVKVK